MKTVKLNIFEIFSLGWIGLSLLSLLLVLINSFYLITAATAIFAVILITWLLVKKKFIEITGLKKSSWIIFSFICAFGIFLSIFTAPTIFGGRDEGSYAINAIMMAKNHTAVYSSELINQFFHIYGPGKSLNFPGFYYTEEGFLKSQFLPAYPSWIAIWYNFFGLNGIKFANLFPFITFLFSFYLLVGRIIKKTRPLFFNKKPDLTIPVAGLLILATTFPILVFYKFTLGEIYFASLLWFTVYLFYRYSRDKSGFRYGLMFLPLAILPFIRVEAFILIFMFLFIFILKDYSHFKLPRYQLPFVLLGVIFIIVFAYEPNFFIDSLKNIAAPFFSAENSSEKKGFSILPDDWQGLYSLKLFYTYNLLPIFILGAAFLLNFLRKSQQKMIKSRSFFIPLVFFAPTFIYLIDANISLDHPWYLRRLVFTVIPVFVFYACFLLFQIKLASRWIFWPITILIILTNILLLFPINQNGKNQPSFFTFRQNNNLFAQTKELSANFSPNDLILISQQSSGSGWSLMSEPLREILDKQAIYFFNPNDLVKINREKFENIYLISSSSELELYNELAKTAVEKYEINNTIIQPSKNPQQKPAVLKTQTSAIIFQIEK